MDDSTFCFVFFRLSSCNQLMRKMNHTNSAQQIGSLKITSTVALGICFICVLTNAITLWYIL